MLPVVLPNTILPTTYYSPLLDEFVLELATCLALELLRLAVFDTATMYPGTITFSPSPYSRPGGAQTLRLGLHLFSTGWCANFASRSPLIYGPGGRSPRQCGATVKSFPSVAQDRSPVACPPDGEAYRLAPKPCVEALSPSMTRTSVPYHSTHLAKHA